MTHYYSQRLVNPFRGILSVVETEDADAVSNDGIHWALYIHGQHELALLNDGTQRDVALPDVKYGDWSRQCGFKHAPIRNVVDYRQLDAIGAHLLAAVKFAAEQLPFPLRDHYELWLLDTDLALPSSSRHTTATTTVTDHGGAAWARTPCPPYREVKPGFRIRSTQATLAGAMRGGGCGLCCAGEAGDGSASPRAAWW